ncbi:DUF3278 domain-containing protein [Apilactobacillus micheneri]|uniref:DUF3278 domain-containing protein n=1 Tax=Apilactobacillus micheneri TaxID=1899430 RepID=A0A9Q8MTS1_9LACO|nr:DUF3278 domain-containing protein [Apilactobacillus micheneri]TPR40010.1 DUF3278 domain-containing protein [Apilactobacillus micheneri]TPR41821.1 DUF3278 domain-containing protein [Apilactobacillus micheneri]TPR44212.1 DUF3278 domain-containing protein [Apilactobacillus micheneri]TPR45836.1 DUF3278 domain-containing protein [Apilactobacillus micheneri]TPR50580.1 DUF3278 domain-containing protein [Apilactobacillus micheneri]
MKKQKESLYVKFIKYLYNINDNFDEYKKSQVNRIGNNSFIFLIVYFWLESMAMCLVANSSLDLSIVLFIMLFSNLLILVIIFCYISSSISNLKLDQVDVYDEKDYRLKLKDTAKKSLIVSLIFFYFERLISFLSDILNSSQSIIDLIVSPYQNLVGLLITIIVGVSYYSKLRSKIKK